MPLDFKQHGSNGKYKVLCQKKTLYGLHQSPCAFWKYLTKKLGNCGLPQAPFDPCLFICEKVIAICYVDDLIFWAKQKDIVELAVQLHAEKVDLEQEDDAAGFLGVHIEPDLNTGILSMTQKSLIKQVLETLGLSVGTANGEFTPAKGEPLAKHVHREPASGDFNYSSVVAMLLYLAGHMHPDITYAVNCAARYMFCPKFMIEQALNQIGCYLKATADKG